MSWYSWPMAELCISVTKYFTPLLPPGACFHSHCSSKSSNSRSVMISPPPLPRQCNQPSSTTQPFCGNVVCLKLRQPWVVLPSNNSFQPPDFSSLVRSLTLAPNPTNMPPRINTEHRIIELSRRSVCMLSCEYNLVQSAIK